MVKEILKIAKHQILNENGLTIEQTHLLGSISDDNPFIKNVNVPSESHDMTGRITILSKDDKKDKKHNPKPYDIQKGKLKNKVQVPKDNTALKNHHQ